MKLLSAQQLRISPKQRKNIAKLAIFVKDKVAPPKFDIKYLFKVKTEDSIQRMEDQCSPTYECGSSACFLGYAPLAGIQPEEGDTWEKYSLRNFGASSDFPINIYSLYLFLFGEGHKNSKTAACKRATWFLQFGLPATPYWKLGIWEAPKEFKPDWKAIAKIAT